MYLYKLINTNNGAEISSEGNSRTEPNSSQETAPLGHQLFVQGGPDTKRGSQPREEGKHQLPSSGLPPTSSPCRSWESLLQTTPSSCSAPGRKHLPTLAPLTFSLGKKHPGSPSFSTHQLPVESWSGGGIMSPAQRGC